MHARFRVWSLLFCCALIACSAFPSWADRCRSWKFTGPQGRTAEGAAKDDSRLQALLREFLTSKEDGSASMILYYGRDAQQTELVKKRDWVVLTSRGRSEEMLCSQFLQTIQSPAERGVVKGCRLGMMKVGAALQKYAQEHRGQYPKSLSQLVPKYLSGLPACPSSGKESYSGSYQIQGQTARFHCSSSHPSLPAGEPSYDSTKGLSPAGR